jgi:hypothetical protein
MTHCLGIASDDISDCNSEEIHSNSDSTESFSSIASSTDTVSAGGNGNGTISTGSDDVDESDEDDSNDESSLWIDNSVQSNIMSDCCTNCQWHQMALGFYDTMSCVLSLSTYSSASMRTRVGWLLCEYSDDL